MRNPPVAAIYTRVSTELQNTDVQVSDLTGYADRRGWRYEIFRDIQSGANCSRQNFDLMMGQIRRGRFDILLAHRVDRIGRSLVHLAQLFGELRDLQVGLVIPSQGIDTSSPETNPGALLQLNILSAVASWERDLISIRTKDALRIRKARGVKLGRPPIDNNEKNKVKDLLNQGVSPVKVSQETHISLPTVYRIRKEFFRTLLLINHEVTKEIRLMI